MEEWKECRLGDYCDFQNGYAFKSSEFKTNGEYKIVKIKELKDGLVKFFDDSASVDIHDIKEFEKYKIYRNDVLFALTGDPVSKPNPLSWVGRVSIYRSDENALLNQRTCKIKKSDEIDNQFLYYYFRQWENFYALASKATGSASQANISTNTIADTIIKLPPLPTQQKIADILSSLDDKIELNNKINTNLEQQAQALFKNFSEKSSKSVKFTDLIYILGGGTPKTNNEDYWNGKIPFFTPKDVGNPYCLLTEKKITETGLDNCNSRLYPVNTIFVTARGTVGKVCLAGLPMAMNQSCYALKSKEDNQLLAYFYTLEAINSLKHKANGATFDAIVTRDFETETINILSEQDTKEFTQIVKPIFEKILTNQKENINLSNLRDTLLPKLMNGDLETNHMGD